jgi:hypothetical protein
MAPPWLVMKVIVPNRSARAEPTRRVYAKPAAQLRPVECGPLSALDGAAPGLALPSREEPGRLRAAHIGGMTAFQR